MINLSVIIPVYNVEAYLSKCLDSVIAADRQDYEIILVNDGSTDSSPAIAEAYVRRYPDLITLISTENRGQGNARNVGIEQARGEFLYFIDSDDYLAQGGMEEILSCPSLGYDICIFDTIAVNISGDSIKYMPGCEQRENLNLDDYPALLLQGPDVWNKVIRRRLFTDHGLRFPTGVWFEDLRTIPKLYQYTDSIIYLPHAWHRYLQRYNSVTNTKKTRRNLEIIPAVDDVVSFYRQAGRGESLKDELEYLAFHSQFLTSSVRANLSDWRSTVQEELMLDFLRKYPDFRDNHYVKEMSPGHKLLTFLLLHRMRLAVHLLMKGNSIVKRKKN